MVFSFVVTDVFASLFTVINVNFQSLRGIRTEIYFESANASAASSPITVNTAKTIPSTSSSYRILPGRSVYLWAPQYSTATTLPDSKMTLDIWAASTPEINGQASQSFRATSGAVSLTTNQSNDLIYVVTSVDDIAATVSISGGGLTWQQRGKATAVTGVVYTHWAIASTPLSAATITATIGSREYFVLTAFAVSGVDTTNPFDPNLSTPAVNNGNSNTASVSFTTATKNDFIIGSLYINGVPKSSIIGAGFTGISTLSSGKMTGSVEYQNAANSGTYTPTFALGTTINYWSIVGDALVPASSGAIIKVSAYTTTSTGTVQSTLFSNQNANPTSQEGGQVATCFSTSAGTIPASGYIQVVLTAPTSSTIIVTWGRDQPTNVQICTTYSSPV